MKINANIYSVRNISMKGILYDIKNRADKDGIPEEEFDNKIKQLPTGRFTGRILPEKLDALDLTIYGTIRDALRTRSGDEIVKPKKVKEYFQDGITKVTAEEYNGRQAEVTKNLAGAILSVNTGASTPEEACEHMGIQELKNPYNTNPIRIYGRKEDPKCFVWNYKTHSMDWYFGNNKPEWFEEISE